MTGTILGQLDKEFIIQPTESKPNRNIMVVGGPGSFKTQGFVITNGYKNERRKINEQMKKVP